MSGGGAFGSQCPPQAVLTFLKLRFQGIHQVIASDHHCYTYVHLPTHRHVITSSCVVCIRTIISENIHCILNIL